MCVFWAPTNRARGGENPAMLQQRVYAQRNSLRRAILSFHDKETEIHHASEHAAASERISRTLDNLTRTLLLDFRRRGGSHTDKHGAKEGSCLKLCFIDCKPMLDLLVVLYSVLSSPKAFNGFKTLLKTQGNGLERLSSK